MRDDAPSITADDLKATAYHEAGHAIVRLALDLSFWRVSIVPDEDTRGKVVHRPLPESVIREVNGLRVAPQTRDRLEREIVASYAGHAAQELVDKKRADETWESDREVGANWALKISGSAAEADAYIAWLYERARSLVALPLHRDRIDAIARALLERQELSYDECIAINRQVLSRRVTQAPSAQ